MSIFVEKDNIMFSEKEHFLFYKEKCEELNPDVYLKALIYTVGIADDTRRRWASFYDMKQRSINPAIINDGWQTSGTMRITRLAFQLFTDGTPTVGDSESETENLKECRRYSVSDIFCCGYAPFYVEAIKLRYPEYMSKKKVYIEE